MSLLIWTYDISSRVFEKPPVYDWIRYSFPEFVQCMQAPRFYFFHAPAIVLKLKYEIKFEILNKTFFPELK